MHDAQENAMNRGILAFIWDFAPLNFDEIVEKLDEVIKMYEKKEAKTPARQARSARKMKCD